MVINIAHTSAAMYKIFFHAYSIPWYQKSHNKIPNIFSFFYNAGYSFLQKAFIGENWTKTVLLFLFIMSTDMHSLRFHLGNWIAEDSRFLS